MIEWASSLWWHNRFIPRNARPHQELLDFEKSRPDAQRLELAKRLLEQIRYFGNRGDALPEWKEAARIQDPLELWRQWPSLPVLGKKDLQTRFHPKEMQSRFGLNGRPNSTGGSTGEPTPFLYDEAMVLAANGADVYTRLRMGWRPGMPTVTVWGSDLDIGKTVPWRTRLADSLANTIHVDGYNMDAARIDRLREALRPHKRVAMYGFSAMLEFVAEGLLARGEPMPGKVQVAWNGGEVLLDSQVEVFRRAFGVAILNRYGGRELSAIACQFSEGAPLTIIRPWIYVELLNEQGKPAAPGEAASVVCTSTICRGTPFLRYAIEDIAVAGPARHSESGIDGFDKLEGRLGGLLTLPDGRKVGCLFWNHLFKEVTEVKQFQVTLRRDGSLRFLLRGDGLAAEREQKLRAALTGFTGITAMEFVWVDEIPRTARGKFVQVIREN